MLQGYGELRVPLLQRCKERLIDDWATSWIEHYRIDESTFAVFGNGSLLCYRRNKFLYVHEVECSLFSMTYQFVNEKASFDNIIPTIENCFALYESIIPKNPIPNVVTYNRIYNSGDRSFFSFCYVVGIMTEIPQVVECPNDIKNYKINPKNFIFKVDGIMKYQPPTVGQYQFLKSINHISVSTDDYDYDHQN